MGIVVELVGILSGEVDVVLVSDDKVELREGIVNVCRAKLSDGVMEVWFGPGFRVEAPRKGPVKSLLEESKQHNITFGP